MSIELAERERRRRLVQAHMAAETAHDLDAIMDTFADGAKMIFNSVPFETADAIAAAHQGFGMSKEPGSLADLRVVQVGEHFTDDEIVIEGRLEGTHVGDFVGYPPTQKRISMPYVATYRFDDSGKLAEEHVVMNFIAFGKPE